MGSDEQLRAMFESYLTNTFLMAENTFYQSTYRTIQEILDRPRYAEPGRLIRSGYRVYSQNDEDGIIAEIFNRIGTTNKYFVEIGSGDGTENNSVTLLLQGWKGLWIEGNQDAAKNIGSRFPKSINQQHLLAICTHVTKDNISALLKQHRVMEDLDFMSIDIDGNDYYIFQSLEHFSPRVVCIEYNAKFRPPIEFKIPYDPGFKWTGSDFFGASLKSLEKLFAQKGYSLVGCNITGVNAFFVRNDLVGSHFCAPFTSENHYEPSRHWLTFGNVAGHRSDYKELISNPGINWSSGMYGGYSAPSTDSSPWGF